MPTESTTADVDLVVVTFNSGEVVDACLRSLAADVEDGARVVVVDNHSSDDTVDLVRSFGRRVQLIETGENLGFAAACNLGAAGSTSRYLALVNPDVEVTASWLRPLLAALDADPRMAMVSATTLGPGVPIPLGSPVTRAVGAVPACALLVRRAAWDELHGMDDTIFLYSEDTDLCWRAAQHGFVIGENMASFVYHDRGGSSARTDVSIVALRSRVYVLLKSAPPRALITEIPRAVLATIDTCLRRRDFSAFAAWGWNLRHLPSTWANRRGLRRTRVVSWSELDRLRRAHAARARMENRDRRRRPR